MVVVDQDIGNELLFLCREGRRPICDLWTDVDLHQCVRTSGAIPHLQTSGAIRESSEQLRREGGERSPHPQQGAGEVHAGLGQQLAGQVKEGPGLHGGQGHQRGRGQHPLASSPGPQLLHSTAILLIKVEAAAGSPWLHGSILQAAEGHHRGGRGVDQHDGVFEGQTLRGEPASSNHTADPVGGVLCLTESGP